MTDPRQAPGTPRQIVVRGVNWLGDAVMTTPALLRLREAYPNARITLLSPEKLSDLWLHHPAVDAVLPLRPRESLGTVGRRLRDGRFDLGIVFPNSPRAALELWWGQVPRRVGYATAWRRWWLTDALPRRPGYVAMRKRSRREIRDLVGSAPPGSPERPPATAHHLHQYLHLVGHVGANPAPLPPRIVVTDAEVAATIQRLGLPVSPASDPPWLGINAGAEYGPAKRWPRDRFVAAAVAVQRQTRSRWLVLGGPADTELAASITAEIAAATKRQSTAEATSPPGVVNLAGRTSLRELCALLKLCRVVLTNDTGPMHLAAAVGTPVVVPFGSTSPELTGPGLPGDPRHRLLPANVPCRPCFLRECPIDFRCMHSVSVEQVFGAVREALGAP